jgi:hypothetical protein
MDTLHAPFPPSQPSWLNYTDEQLIEALKNKYRAEIGTEIHEWASHQIILSSKVSGIKEVEKGVKTHIYEKYMEKYSKYYDHEFGTLLLKHLHYIPGEAFLTTKQFINDSIGFRMESEKRLTVSSMIYGTADAVRYYTKENLLRVSDLKTGKRPAKIEQVFIYAALYCYEYNLKPLNTNFEARIYQNGEIFIEQPSGEDIDDILKNILHKDEVAKKFEGGKG